MWPDWMVAGGLLVLIAIGWRQVHRHRLRSRVAQALRDADPVCRLAAVGVATEQGLRAYAGLLLSRVDTETDADVRTALADGVLRNAWEPADRPSILRLRLWAHEERARRAPSPAIRFPTPLPHRRPVPPQGLPRHRAPAPTPFSLVTEGHGGTERPA